MLASLPAGERELLVDALARLVGERLAAPTPCGGSGPQALTRSARK